MRSRRTLEFLAGSPNGEFLLHSIVSISNRSHAVAVADFDRDGIADVASAGVDPPAVVILRGLGHGEFEVLPAISIPTDADAILVSDLDADGWPDLVTWSGAGINILRNDGAGGFLPPIPFAGNGAVAIGRIDTDAYADLVLRGTAGLNVYPGLGDGTFGPVRLVPGGCHPNQPYLADFDGDGDLEILAIDGCGDVVENSSTLVFVNDRSGDFPVVRTNVTDGSASSVAVGDVDGDHRPDAMVMAGAVLNLMMLESAGLFQNTWARHMQSYSTPIAADVNRDGCDDVIQADGTGISVLLGSFTRSFARPALNAGDVPRELLATRIDDGGTIDLVVTRPYVEALTFGLSGPGDTFDMVYRGIDGAAEHFVADDLDLDGHRDVVAADAKIDIERGVGNGTFIHNQRLNIAGRIATARLDADAYPELWVAKGDSLLALHNRGDGTFEPAQAWVGGGDRILARDVNSDGRADIVLGRGTQIVVRLADGSGGLEAETAYETGASFHSDVEIADLDGDGPIDIVVAHYGVIPIGWLRARGDGTFDAVQALDLPPTERFALADWDGDGRLDAASISGKVAVSFNLGGHHFGTPLWLGSGHNPVDIATGDFDSDDRPDIAVLNLNYFQHGETWGDVDVMFNRISPGLISSVPPGAPSETFGLAMHAPAPNPMRSTTRARFSIAGIHAIEARVLDLQGREVVTLLRGKSTGAEQEVAWNGRDVRGARVQAGVYFLQVRSESLSGARRIVVLE